ncbi:MAG: glycosyltransferase family 2 protein, partial [Oscillospiraceae bacterium]
AVAHTIPNVDFEFLFIDDGSKDDTLAVLKLLSDEDDRFHYISFSRNFGKEAAMYAGLEQATGDYVAIMDADLQDPPNLLPQMIEILDNEDYDCVATRRVTRDGEPPMRSFFAKMFYKIINKISPQTDIVDGARDFRLMKRPMVDAIVSLREYNRFSKGIFGWVGFKTKWLPFVNVERVAGETKWSFWKLFLYSIEGIIAFSTTPLAIVTIMGLFICLCAFVGVIVIVAKTIMYGDPVGGWPSMVCIMLLLGGIQTFSVGIVGDYLAKTYLEVKNRPIYIVREKK